MRVSLNFHASGPRSRVTWTHRFWIIPTSLSQTTHRVLWHREETAMLHSKMRATLPTIRLHIHYRRGRAPDSTCRARFVF